MHLLPHAIVWLAVVALLWHCRYERIALRLHAQRLLPIRGDSLTAALHLGGAIFAKTPRREDPSFGFPILGPIGASPLAVLRNGGCCSGLARLHILTLQAVGIPAAQITLYHRTGRAQHCLVEAHIDSRRILIDPMYGVWYRTPAGATLALEDLQAGCQPCFAPLPFSEAVAYPRHSYYDFEYRNTKTANWTKSPLRRVAYRILACLSRGQVDRWRLPPILEWPQIILTLALLTTIGVYDLCLLAGSSP